MLTVATLLEALHGLDPEAQVVVGIINGPAYNAAYAEQQVRGTAVQLSAERFELHGEGSVLYVCCYVQPRPWEGPPPVGWPPAPGTSLRVAGTPSRSPTPPRTRWPAAWSLG